MKFDYYIEPSKFVNMYINNPIIKLENMRKLRITLLLLLLFAKLAVKFSSSLQNYYII